MNGFVFFAARWAVRHRRALDTMEVFEEGGMPGTQLGEDPELSPCQARRSLEEGSSGQGGVDRGELPSSPRRFPLRSCLLAQPLEVGALRCRDTAWEALAEPRRQGCGRAAFDMVFNRGTATVRS